MFREQIKSDSGDLATEMMLLLEAYGEFHRILCFMLHTQELIVESPDEVNEYVCAGQCYCNRVLRERSEALKHRIGELCGMVKGD